MSKNTALPANLHPQTRLIHEGVMRSQYGETSEAIYLNSGFCYESAETAEKRFNGEEPGFVYSRYSNPSLAMVEQRLADLEGADAAFVMASGMAAVFASLMCQVQAGDHVVANRALFSSNFYILNTLLPRYGVEVTLVDGRDMAAWEKALSRKTRCVFVETPTNPSLEIVDIRKVAELTHKAGGLLIVDNVFATPLLQKPLELGADVVVYSTTKHMDGQGRCLGGAVLGGKDFMENTLLPFHRHTGPAMSPFTAWILHKALETFALRMETHTSNAEKMAVYLESQTGKGKIKSVTYPGLASHPQHQLAISQMKRGGPLVSFEVEGGKEAAFRLLNKLRIMTISNNLGDAKTLVTHPATSTHASVPAEQRHLFGISDGTIRMALGLEHSDDLMADMEQALNHLQPAQNTMQTA